MFVIICLYIYLYIHLYIFIYVFIYIFVIQGQAGSDMHFIAFTAEIAIELSFSNSVSTNKRLLLLNYNKASVPS